MNFFNSATGNLFSPYSNTSYSSNNTSILSYQPSDTYANFENVQHAINHPHDFLLVNTLSIETQRCLIQNTIPANDEEHIINEMLHTLHLPDKKIIVYGKYANDPTVERKHQQLSGMGVEHVYIYSGGMFEWMLLQDIYGTEDFPTTSQERDLLFFRGPGIRH